MKNKKIMIIIALLIVLSISLSLTMALYKSSKSGQAQLSVASPKIRLVNETTHIEELDLKHYSNNFKVVSYDESGKNSEVGLKYNLKLEITDEDAPIDMKLFKINSNGTETEVELNKNLETKSTYNFEAGKNKKMNID